ncbi:hypothetical protein STFR1_20250 [Bacillus vallismortis]
MAEMIQVVRTTATRAIMLKRKKTKLTNWMSIYKREHDESSNEIA